MITTLVMFYLQPTPAATAVFLCSLFFSVITWIIAFFKRRTAHCALCKGTPLIDSGALAHQKAKRLFPFSYGVTATLSIIATQKFRCMYCGTEFDLLKPSTLSSQNHSHGSLKYQDSYTSYTSYTEYKSDEDAD